MGDAVPIKKISARAYTIPTDKPEADGTIAWNSTTLVVVQITADNQVGLGYSYSNASIVNLIEGKLAEIVLGLNALSPQIAWQAMRVAVRNLGLAGLAATAISAIDAALHDLKARLLNLPLVVCLGGYRAEVPIYGSGGFTTYTVQELQDQLGRWVERDGCRFVKMKVGSRPENDPKRVAAAKSAIGDAILFVDANGAYSVPQALSLADLFAAHQVGWFEEPVSSDNLQGLREIRERAPFGMDIAAGEYAYTAYYVREMLEAHAVDVQQADVTRCGGITGFLQIAALCEAFQCDLSGHCAPALHLHVACAAPRLRHLEWFHDHVRIERLVFEGAPVPDNGAIRPDLSCAGNGLTFKHQDAARFAV